MDQKVDLAIATADEAAWAVRLGVFEQMRNLVILWREDRIAFVNSAGLAWLDYSGGAELIGQGLDILLHEDYLDMVPLGIEALVEEDMIPLKIYTRDRKEIELEMWFSRLDVPGAEIFLLEASDITEHLRMARALGAREQWLEGIINTVADGIITIDDTGIIQSFNPAAENIFKFQADEIIGKSIRDLMSDPVALSFIDAPDAPGIAPLNQGAETSGRRKDGNIFPMEMSIRELFHEDRVTFTSVVRDITTRKRAEERIRRQAHYDVLTGIPNRYLLGDRLDEAISRERRHGDKMALLYLDLDSFKPINDRLGHAFGDKVLIEIARRLRGCLRDSDTVARVGGDEFIVILEELNEKSEAGAVAAKIIEAVSTPLDIDAEQARVGISVGIAMMPDQADNAERLVHLADLAMYDAKKIVTNKFVYYGE